MTLAELRTALQALGYGTDTDAQQMIFLNAAYREVTSGDRWPFLEKQDFSLVTTAGTPRYSIGTLTDFAQIDAVRLSDTFASYNMENVPPQTMRDLETQDGVTWDTPIKWSIIAELIHLWPTPDRQYSILIDYIYKPPDLVADGDIPAIPSQYHDVLVFGAAKYMAQRSRDIYSANFWDSEYQRKLQKMRQSYLLRQRQTSSKVRESGMWDSRRRFPDTIW